MASEAIITATFGAPGSGKTYSRVKWLVEDFLVNNPSGLYISNIPINRDAVADYFCKIHKEVDRQSILDRLILIPYENLIFWEKLNQLENRDLNSFTSETFPPSAYLQQYNLEGAHIAIDEFHKYFSKKGPKILKKLWNDWFAEIRKTGCVFEAITQSYGQMSDEFLDKCATRLELINHSDLRDPFFGCKMGDWYELRAGLLGKLPVQRVTEKETMRGTSLTGRLNWVPTGKCNSFVLEPEFFKLYNSFHNLTGVSGVRKSPSEIFGKGIVFWFLRRNWVSILPRCLVAIFIVWFLLFGGFKMCLSGLFSVFDYAGKSNAPESVLQAGKQPSIENKTEKTALKQTSSQAQNQSENVPAVSDHESVSDLAREKQESLSLYKPCLFFNEMVFLRNGYEIYKGYKFNDKGVYHGRVIKEINRYKRFYLLDDGTIVSMFGL